MAIMSNGNLPYVHSKIQNFHKVSSLYNKEVAENGINKMDETINRLVGIRDTLAEAAKSVGLSPSEATSYQKFLELTGNSDNFEKQIANRIIQILETSQELFAFIEGNTNIDFSENFKKKAAENYKKLNLDTSSGLVLKEFKERIVDWLTKSGRNFFEVETREGQRANIQKRFSNLGIKISDEEINEIIKVKVKENGKAYLNRIVDLLKDKSAITFGANAGNSTTVDFIITYLRGKLNNEFKEDSNALKIEGQENHKKIINKVLKTFEKNLRDTGLDKIYENFNKATIRGDIVEWGVGTILRTYTEDGIELIGNIHEENIREEILRKASKAIPKHFSSTGKMSYSDWIITKNGFKARVQVKSGGGLISYIDRRGKLDGNLQDPKAASGGASFRSIKLEDSLSIPDFLNKFGVMGTDINELLYTLVNQIWFSKAGTRVKSTTEKIPYDYSTLTPIFSAPLLDAFGVAMADEFNVDTDMSNIFYYNAGYFIPVAMIINDIINVSKEIKNTLTISKPTIKVGAFDANAKNFFHKKRIAVEGTSEKRLRKNGSYTNSALLAAGAEKGQEILDATKITNLNLTINYKVLFSSSYLF